MVPRYLRIFCRIGKILKTFIRPMVRKNINEVNPRVTPKIRGIVFVIPKLNPEYDATTLFGPGVKAATNQKRAIDNISGCIIIMQSVDHFQLFEKDELK